MPLPSSSGIFIVEPSRPRQPRDIIPIRETSQPRPRQCIYWHRAEGDRIWTVIVRRWRNDDVSACSLCPECEAIPGEDGQAMCKRTIYNVHLGESLAPAEIELYRLPDRAITPN